MKLFNKLTPLATAAAVAATMLVTPNVQAGVSASIGIANMYLWRGTNEASSSQTSGELKWTKGDLYYGTWVSNSGSGGSETDLFVGYGFKAGPVDIDVSYWNYLYPGAVETGGDGLFDTNYNEIVTTVSIDSFTGGLYINIDGDRNDDMYLTAAYAWDKYTATFGLWIRENSTDNGYSHITVSYAATDALTFTVSKAFDDSSVATDAVEEDPLVAVSYGWNFDLKK